MARTARGVDPQAVLEAIHVHIDRNGRPPLSTEWRPPDRDQIPPTRVVINRLSSWRAATTATRSPWDDAS